MNATLRNPRRNPGQIAFRLFFVGLLLGILLPGLASCGAEDTKPRPVPEPVSLADPEACDVCGMVIARHPGPNGQIFYADHKPGGHDNPARFDSLRQGLFPYYFDHERLGWEATVVYVTDYSRIGLELREEDGQTYVQGSTEPGSFVNAKEAYFMVGSRVHGAMGPEFLPFSNREDAEQFTRRHGGRVLGFEDLTPDLLRR